MLRVLATLLSCLAVSTTVECRDTSKAIKSIPSISSSLVNLGKMDISFHFNAKDSPMKADGYLGPANTFLYSKSEPVEEPCPCSSFRNMRDPFSHNPSDMLHKILLSNDLFSYNKEPTLSTLCCESHEHDEFVTFEFGPKHANAVPIQPNVAEMPFYFENLIPRKPSTSSMSKSKAVEIFLFPKNNDLFKKFKNDLVKKDTIQIVGNKELKNDFKNFKFRPAESVSSVKKDLTAQEKNETKPWADFEKTQHISTLSSLNAL